MVTSYRANNDGTMTKISNDNYFAKKSEVEKTLNQIDQIGKWFSLHGVNLFVVDNVITQGPDVLIGKSWEDIKILKYLDIFQIMRNEQKTKQILSKSLLIGPNQVSQLSSSEKSEIENIQNDTNEYISSRIDFYKNQSESIKDPLYKL